MPVAALEHLRSIARPSWNEPEAPGEDSSGDMARESGCLHHAVDLIASLAGFICDPDASQNSIHRDRLGDRNRGDGDLRAMAAS